VNDAHAAVVKRLLWRLARAGDRTEGPQQLAEIASHMKNTNAFFFERFDHEQQFDVSAIPGLKSAHFFEWSGEKEGEKYVIVCGKIYPECLQMGAIKSSDDGNISHVAVEAFYSVDFDDVSGSNLDMSATEVAELCAKEAIEQKEKRLRDRAEAVLNQLRKKGTRVAIRYDVEGRKLGQWWNGVVLSHRQLVGKEQIQVKYVIDAVSAHRGLKNEMTEWVDLDTDVRIAS